MANEPTAKSGTLTGGQITSVSVAIEPYGAGNSFTVTNRSMTGTIWVRLDGQNPTVAGDNCFPVLGTRTFTAKDGVSVVTVKLISAAALEYTVEGREG